MLKISSQKVLTNSSKNLIKISLKTEWFKLRVDILRSQAKCCKRQHRGDTLTQQKVTNHILGIKRLKWFTPLCAAPIRRDTFWQKRLILRSSQSSLQKGRPLVRCTSHCCCRFQGQFHGNSKALSCILSKMFYGLLYSLIKIVPPGSCL